MNNWNFEDLGARSEQELKESIERVKEQMKNPKNDLEERAINKVKFDSMNVNGGIDLKGLEEGARLAELDRVVSNKLHWEKEAAKVKAEQEEINKLMEKAAEKIKTDNEAEAQKEFEKQKAKAEAELQKEVYANHGVKTDKQKAETELYKSLLKGLNI